MKGHFDRPHNHVSKRNAVPDFNAKHSGNKSTTSRGNRQDDRFKSTPSAPGRSAYDGVDNTNHAGEHDPRAHMYHENSGIGSRNQGHTFRGVRGY
jgi:hypothetical protein